MCITTLSSPISVGDIDSPARTLIFNPCKNASLILSVCHIICFSTKLMWATILFYATFVHKLILKGVGQRPPGKLRGRPRVIG